MSDTTTDTTWVLTETDLLDKLDELGFISITVHRSDPEITIPSLAWHAAAVAPADHPVPATYVNGMDGRYSTTRQDPDNLGYLHAGHYGPTRYDALAALVALAEQQANR